MPVQSFNRQVDQESFDYFVQFSNLMQASVTEGFLSESDGFSTGSNVARLLLGSISCELAGLDRLGAAV